jgi:hypothetical protein
MRVKKILLLLLVVCCTTYTQGITYNKQEWQGLESRVIKGNFDALEDFYYATQIGFLKYFKKYSPRLVSKNGEELVMSAQYGKYSIVCIFYQNENSQYIVSIDTKFKRDRIKWLESIVKHVEKQGER